MGNWRYLRPRRFFYRQYTDPASSYYASDEPSPPHPAFTEDGVPSWEKKFCSLIGSVPWQKIVNAKNFIYCHDSVVNWDDSAGAKAFQSAKQRFWAEINGIPCECSLPNPDMYIDEIDWNPNIDPKLIKDLEQAFFAPEEEECKLEWNNKKTRNLMSVPSEGWKRNPGEVRTPWEWDNDIRNSVALEDKTQGWNQWPNSTNNSTNLNNSDNLWKSWFPLANEAMKSNTWGDCSTSDKLQGWNHSGKNVNQLKDWNNSTLNNDEYPWEQSFPQKNEFSKGNAWEDGREKMWEWNCGGNQLNQSRDWDGSGNPWKRSSLDAGPVKEKAWGRPGHSYRENNNKVGMGKMNNGGNQWESNFIRGNGGPTDRQQRRSGWRQWADHYKEPKDLEFRQSNDSWGTWTEGHRKREGRHQYVIGKKHVRFRGNDYDYQTVRHRRGGITKKRVGLAFE